MAFAWEAVHLDLMASLVVVPLAVGVEGPSAVREVVPSMDPEAVEACQQEEVRYLVSNLKEGAPLASEEVVPSAARVVDPPLAFEAEGPLAIKEVDPSVVEEVGPLVAEEEGPLVVREEVPLMDPEAVEAYLQEEARYLVSDLKVTVEEAPSSGASSLATQVAMVAASSYLPLACLAIIKVASSSATEVVVSLA